MSEGVRVRFAPSPTGHLHIGGARTAIYNWAFARHHKGTFVLRIDDTDRERSTDENTQAIMRAMRWLGLDWDEGPDIGGESGPYFQTQRGDLYAASLRSLQESHRAYPCFCSQETLEQKRNAAHGKDGSFGYDRTCRGISPQDAAARILAGEPHVWRVKVPEDRGDVVIEDAIRGTVSWAGDSLDDFILVRTDGSPTYMFATVVDDSGMGITHIIRGDDHLSNTPRQIIVYEALGVDVPIFAHMGLIFGADGKRLSKRHGATSVEAYAEQGYLSDVLLNYLALLGWSLDDTTNIFDRERLITEFDLSRVSKNPAVWDPDKLDWMNGVYLREMSDDGFVEVILPWLERAGLATPQDAAERPDWYRSLAPLISERVKRLDEVAPMVRYLFDDDLPIDEKSRVKVLEQGWCLRGAARCCREARNARYLQGREDRGSPSRNSRGHRHQTEDRVSGRSRGRHRKHGESPAVRVPRTTRQAPDSRANPCCREACMIVASSRVDSLLLRR